MSRLFSSGLWVFAQSEEKYGGYVGSWTVLDQIKAAASVPGLKGLELIAPLHVSTENVKEVKSWMEDAGLKTVAVNPYLWTESQWRYGAISAPDPKVRALAVDTAKKLTAIMHQNEDILVGIVTQLGDYVEATANGDEAKIKSAGFDVKSSSAHIGELHSPLNFSVSHGDEEGEIDLHWDSIKGAHSYEVQMCTDPLTSTGWTHATNCTKSQCTITKLKSMAKTWFRVSAVLASDQGPWSDPVAKVAQ